MTGPPHRPPSGGPRTPLEALVEEAAAAGPVLEKTDPDGRRVLYLSTVALADEVCDDARFDKGLGFGLMQARRIAGDGLFTANTDEPNWGRAHRILVPRFAPGVIPAYLPEMWDITGQLLLKWQRLEPDEDIDVVEDYVRLTLDTIALCGFGYRTNSFYRETPHPFAAHLTEAFAIAQRRRTGLPPTDPTEDARFDAAVEGMNTLVDEVIVRRRARGPPDGPPRDFLDTALFSGDPRTGERLDDENVRYQVITFLIAGHETTSGLLSFATAMLLADEPARTRAVAEVDAVLGRDLDGMPTPAQMARLPWIGQVLEETLRLWPVASQLTRRARAPLVLGGKWPVTPDDDLVLLLPRLHRDPAVWGPDPDRFDPARFSPAEVAARSPNAWKAFGTGQRACIGRHFAMMEASLALAKVLQRFELLDPYGYELRLQQLLTIKPADFALRVRLRPSALPPPVQARTTEARPPMEPRPPMAPRRPTPVSATEPATGPVVATHGTPLLVAFGSNLGTAEGYARRIAEDGDARGWAVQVAPLDALPPALPTDGPVVIVCATYNGAPPDNAAAFVASLEDRGPGTLAGVRYAVFGCGHRDWAATYQKVPAVIDERLAAAGGERLLPRGEGDGRDDLDGMFRAWEEALWSALAAAYGVEERLPVEAPEERAIEVEVLPEPLPNPFVRALDARPFRVLSNRELQRREGPDASERSTRHLELALPEGVTYRTGGHVGVIPHNRSELAARVLARFGLASDARVRVRGAAPGRAVFPDEPLAAGILVMQAVELHERATRPQIRVLSEYTPCPATRRRLDLVAGDDPDSVARYRAWVLEPHRTLLDLLEEAPACTLPFGRFLTMLPPLRPRYYSISSSPLVDPRTCTLTVAVVDAPARSGRGRYQGVGSGYLANRPDGSYISAFVIDSPTFRLPDDPAVPLILVGAGSGLAPLRGALHERTVLRARGAPVGPSMLFFGFRRPDHDFLYEDELRLMEAQGVTKVVTACSHVPGAPCVFVQDQIEAHAEQVWALLEQGAVVLVSGDGAYMAPGVRRAFRDVWRARNEGSVEAATDWLDGLVAEGRYREDVFGSTV